MLYFYFLGHDLRRKVRFFSTAGTRFSRKEVATRCALGRYFLRSSLVQVLLSRDELLTNGELDKKVTKLLDPKYIVKEVKQIQPDIAIPVSFERVLADLTLSSELTHRIFSWVCFVLGCLSLERQDRVGRSIAEAVFAGSLQELRMRRIEPEQTVAVPTELANSITQRTGVKFLRPELLSVALTSSRLKLPAILNCRGVEFLGDAMIANLACRHFLRLRPTIKVELLRDLVTKTVKNVTLKGLSDYFLLSKSVLDQFSRRHGPRRGIVEKNARSRADVLEAYLGALWLDQGDRAVEAFMKRVFEALKMIRERTHRKDERVLEEGVVAGGERFRHP